MILLESDSSKLRRILSTNYDFDQLQFIYHKLLPRIKSDLVQDVANVPLADCSNKFKIVFFNPTTLKKYLHLSNLI